MFAYPGQQAQVAAIEHYILACPHSVPPIDDKRHIACRQMAESIGCTSPSLRELNPAHHELVQVLKHYTTANP
jgi:hypothetical protein